MAFQPMLTELALPSVDCRYMDNAYLAVAYQDNKHLEDATELALYVAAEARGYWLPSPTSTQPGT